MQPTGDCGSVLSLRHASDRTPMSQGEWGNTWNPMTILLGVNLKQRIGNTPLLRFDRLTRGLVVVQVVGKAEWTNPGGSVKDRAATNIVAEALRTGKLGTGMRLL